MNYSTFSMFYLNFSFNFRDKRFQLIHYKFISNLTTDYLIVILMKDLFKIKDYHSMYSL